MMRGFWTAYAYARTCGADGHRIPPLDPVWEKKRDNGTSVFRCELHAPSHASVDFDAVHRAIEVIDSRRSGEASGQITRVGESHAPVLDGFVSRQASVPSRMKPFHEVANDPVIARLYAEDNR